jgi:two-component system sensor histidine kinase ChvG
MTSVEGIGGKAAGTARDHDVSEWRLPRSGAGGRPSFWRRLFGGGGKTKVAAKEHGTDLTRDEMGRAEPHFDASPPHSPPQKTTTAKPAAPQLRARDPAPRATPPKSPRPVKSPMPSADTETVSPTRTRKRTQVRSPSQRSLWASPLTRRILALNVMALAIPVVGLLYLPSYRDSLIQSELELLKTEGKLFSGALAASGVVTGPLGDERLLPETSRQTVRRLVDVSKTRARLFSPDGTLIADSFLLSGPGGVVEIRPLPPLDLTEGVVWKTVTHAYDWVFDRLPSSRHLPPYTENAIQTAADYQEVMQALGGEPATFVRDGGNGSMILSVGVPVQRYRQVLGALFLTKTSNDIQTTMRNTRLTVLGISGVALGITILASLYLASTIALPIHRLADAADRVRRAKGRQATIPDLSRRGDEIGDLSGALRDMTEAVWQRMDAIERFAADVAHEIKNPLTSLRSAVETVARVEDPHQQKKLMMIILEDVQRLDRLISDISDASRVDAEMSRALSGPVKLKDMLLALADIHAATADTEAPRLTVQAPTYSDAGRNDLVVLGAEGRLGQVLRNLISNAISFSPPGGSITVSARREDDQVIVTVDDEGPGIPQDKLRAIFERFYSERPKGERFGTHSGLGLSISKQIIDAHGGTLTAENLRDTGGAVTGARFVITLPAA